MIDNLYDGVYLVDRDRRITYWNKGAERITGYSASYIVGKLCQDNLLNHVNEDGEVLCLTKCPLQATMEDGNPREAEVYVHHANGHRVPILVRASPLRGKDGNIVGAVELFSNNAALISARHESRMYANEALTDPLTGVGNRRFLDLKIKSHLFEFSASGISFGVLFLDIDHFKKFNDRYGHAVGDQVLQVVANTLKSNIRSSDTVGRWGGEEFVCLLETVEERMLTALAEKLRELIRSSRPADLDPSVVITVSVGGTLARPEDTVQSLIERADALMYQSKQHGRNCVTIG
ncbi:MAG: diguanylate cyclase [Candidatus Saccharicenans sp.]|uniref:diguanylate cyclase n=1 Tax=Candidatus Saccharicenans sp. TaxID=2819258 RepID=UPI004049B4FF